MSRSLSTDPKRSEGNGRAQRALLNQLANDRGWSFQWRHVDPLENRRASRAGHEHSEALEALLDRIIVVYTPSPELQAGQLLRHHPAQATRQAPVVEPPELG